MTLYKEIANKVFRMIMAMLVIGLMLSHARSCACMLDDFSVAESCSALCRLAHRLLRLPRTVTALPKTHSCQVTSEVAQSVPLLERPRLERLH